MKKKSMFIILAIVAGLTACEEPESYFLQDDPYAIIHEEGNTVTVEIVDTISIGETPTPEPDPQDLSQVKPFGQDPSLYGDLAFADEFNSSTLDESKWTKHLWYTQEPSIQNYDISDGCLNMWLEVSDGQFVPREFSTEGKFYQTYGYIEMEAKLPKGAGVCPTFWMYNRDLPDLFPEIDIMEAWGWPPDQGYWTAPDGALNNYQGTVHNTSNSKQGHSRLQPNINANLSDDFHVYGCRWDESGVEFFFDGQSLGPKIMTTNHFRRMFIMVWLQVDWLGTATQGSGELSWGNFHTPVGKSNSYSVNYVRVWNLR